MADDPSSSPPNRALIELLSAARSIAIVGTSSKVSSPFAKAIQTLVDAGFSVIPVARRQREIIGRRAYPSITAIPDHVDIVSVFDGEVASVSLADDAVQIGAKTLWLQPGITNATIVQHAADVGLAIVIDRDIVQAVVDFAIIHRGSTVSRDIVEEAGRESFPASDPPPWSRMRPGGPHDQSTDS
jgi:predicted CoA-binding protein